MHIIQHAQYITYTLVVVVDVKDQIWKNGVVL